MSDGGTFQRQGAQRISEMVWRYMDGDTAGVVEWLKRIGCTDFAIDDTQVTFTGATGIRTALTTSDPVNLGVILGMAVAGVYWPMVFPALQQIIGDEWRERTRAAKAHREMARGRVKAKKPQQLKMGLE